MPDNQPNSIPEFISEDRVDAVFSQLDQYVVRLERDPTVLGPSYVHEKLKHCRDHSIAVEALLVEFYDVERKVKNMLSARREAYKAERSELLVLDDEVKKGKSQADREAIADFKLKADIAIISDLREQLVNVQYVLKAIELKKEGLNRTNNDIKKQVALMEFAKSNSNPLATDDDEFDIEDLTEPRGNGKSRSTPEQDSEDIDTLFNVGSVDDTPTDIEDHEETPPEEIPEEVAQHMTPEDEPDPVPGDAEDEDVDAFLDEIRVETEEVDPDDSDLDLDLGVDDEDGEEEGSVEEIDELDLADLFEGNEPLDEKTEDEKKAVKKKGKEDDDAVDIGAFLASQ